MIALTVSAVSAKLLRHSTTRLGAIGQFILADPRTNRHGIPLAGDPVPAFSATAIMLYVPADICPASLVVIAELLEFEAANVPTVNAIVCPMREERGVRTSAPETSGRCAELDKLSSQHASSSRSFHTTRT